VARGDSATWYGETGEWVQSLERELRKRPTGHPEPTGQDLYWSGPVSPYQVDDVPWLDNQDDDRERECGA